MRYFIVLLSLGFLGHSHLAYASCAFFSAPARSVSMNPASREAFWDLTNHLEGEKGTSNDPGIKTRFETVRTPVRNRAAAINAIRKNQDPKNGTIGWAYGDKKFRRLSVDPATTVAELFGQIAIEIDSPHWGYESGIVARIERFMETFPVGTKFQVYEEASREERPDFVALWIIVPDGQRAVLIIEND